MDLLWFDTYNSMNSDMGSETLELNICELKL